MKNRPEGGKYMQEALKNNSIAAQNIAHILVSKEYESYILPPHSKYKGLPILTLELWYEISIQIEHLFVDPVDTKQSNMKQRYFSKEGWYQYHNQKEFIRKLTQALSWSTKVERHIVYDFLYRHDASRETLNTFARSGWGVIFVNYEAFKQHMGKIVQQKAKNNDVKSPHTIPAYAADLVSEKKDATIPGEVARSTKELAKSWKLCMGPHRGIQTVHSLREHIGNFQKYIETYPNIFKDTDRLSDVVTHILEITWKRIELQTVNYLQALEEHWNTFQELFGS